jgi:hypothetical protein
VINEGMLTLCLPSLHLVESATFYSACSGVLRGFMLMPALSLLVSGSVPLDAELPPVC